MATFSARGISSATSTWKSQVLPTMQTASAREFSSAERPGSLSALRPGRRVMPKATKRLVVNLGGSRSEEHTSELQSLMRISYAVFCLKKKTQKVNDTATDANTYHCIDMTI